MLGPTEIALFKPVFKAIRYEPQVLSVLSNLFSNLFILRLIVIVLKCQTIQSATSLHSINSTSAQNGEIGAYI